MRVLVLAVVACALALGSAQPSLAAERYLDEVFPSVSVTSNIAYGQAIDEYGQLETLRLDLYQPAGDTLPARPVLIFVHGGSFTGGDKASPNAAAFARSFAKRGYVSASINYRLREGGFPPEEQFSVVLDAKHDAQAAVRWFRANWSTYGVDTERISISGYSAGAATALFVAYTSSDPGDSGNLGFSSHVAAVVDVSGGMGILADQVMDAGEPPVLIAHGTDDPTSPYSSAEDIVAAAQASGVPYERHALEGEGHGIFNDFLEEIGDWTAGFLYQYVIAGGPIGGFAQPPEIADAGAGDAAWPERETVVAGALIFLASAALFATALARRRARNAREDA